MDAARLYLTAVLCALALQTVYSIKCWECNSRYDPNCGDPFRNETFALTDCDQRDLDHITNQKGSVCRKILQKVKDDYRFVRSCGWISEKEGQADCFKRAGTFNVLIQYCSCDRDGCNSATAASIAAWLMGVATALALVAL